MLSMGENGMNGSGRTLGILDIGSFSVRLLVSSVNGDRVQVLYDRGRVTRLASGLPRNGRLAEERMEDTEESAAQFVEVCRSLGASAVYVIATEAVRRAENGDAMMARLARLATAVEVLTPESEAALAFVANRDLFRKAGPLTVVDVGGGSLQVAWGDDAVEGYVSLPLGVSVISESFVVTDPPTANEKSRLVEHIRELLTAAPLGKEVFREHLCVALGGTMGTLATLDLGLKFHRDMAVLGYRVSRERLRFWARWLLQTQVARRKALPAMGDARAEVIPAGALLLSMLAEVYEISGLTYSNRGIRHGYLQQILAGEPGGTAQGALRVL